MSLVVPVRHGDVLLVRVEALPAQAEQQPSVDSGEAILAYGEVTGHAHRLSGREVRLWDVAGQRYVTVSPSAVEVAADWRSQETGEERQVRGQGAILNHEEHGPVLVPAGTYRVIQQREYSPEEIRTVAD